jgi:hypothetical protein
LELQKKKKKNVFAIYLWKHAPVYVSIFTISFEDRKSEYDQGIRFDIHNHIVKLVPLDEDVWFSIQRAVGPEEFEEVVSVTSLQNVTHGTLLRFKGREFTIKEIEVFDIQ